MNWIYYIYIISVAYFVYKSSKRGTFYIFSPLITIYIAFIFFNIYPLITYTQRLPHNIINVTQITCFINLCFLWIFRKQWNYHIRIKPKFSLKRFANNRKKVFYAFLALILIAGIISGVTPALLAGKDVENLRMTSDIGMGFIKAIPIFGLPYLILEYYFLERKISITKAGIVGLTLGLILFITTAARGGILTYIIFFFAWFNLTHRTFKWYEYFFIFYLAKPLIATLLQLLRSAKLIVLEDFTLFSHEKSIFNANTIPLAEYMERFPSYLCGESYLYPLVRVIPRFLWPEKPIAIDYKYKKMVGYDFSGGGIYTSTDFEMFLNFGYYYVILYILWLLLIHYMYQSIAKRATSFENKLLLLILLSQSIVISGLIQNIQIYFLFLLIFLPLNKKWRII